MTISLNSVLGAINQGLSVIKTVAEVPGVNLLPYASTISGAVTAIQAAAAAGRDIAPYVQAINDTFSGGSVPTSDQVAALDAKISELDALVDAPLPQKEDGEND